MFPLSNRMLILSSIGHAIIFSLAISGAVRIVGAICGTPVSQDTANLVFSICTLITAPFAAYFKIARFVVGGKTT